MHCWILINIRLEYKDMKYFLGMPIFSVLQGLSDQNFGDMEMLQHLNFDKDIFIPKHIIESNKKPRLIIMPVWWSMSSFSSIWID